MNRIYDDETGQIDFHARDDLQNEVYVALESLFAKFEEKYNVRDIGHEIIRVATCIEDDHVIRKMAAKSRRTRPVAIVR